MRHFVFSFCWPFVLPVFFWARLAVSFWLLICRAFAAGETTSTANWGITKSRSSEKKNENKLKRKTSAESCSLNKGFSTQLESVQRVSLGQMNINWPGSVVLTEMNGCQLSRSAENTN